MLGDNGDVQGEHRRLGLGEHDHERRVVGGRHRLEVGHEGAVGRRRVLVGHHQVVGPGDVPRRDRHAVRPLHPGEDRVGPGELVRRGRPGGGHRRHRMVVLRVVVGEEVVHEPVDLRGEDPLRQEGAEGVHTPIRRHRQDPLGHRVRRRGPGGRDQQKGGQHDGGGSQPQQPTARPATASLRPHPSRTMTGNPNRTDGVVEEEAPPVALIAGTGLRRSAGEFREIPHLNSR